MATTSSYPTQHGKLRPLWNSLWLKAAIVIALVLLASAFAVRWYLLHVERAALPQLQGVLRVAGLQSPLTVVRDQHGVPHITAQTVEDLAFAQGYITAQDRLWQMDMIRRVAAGELAEILGAAYIPHDKRQRYLQTRHTAEVAVTHLDAATRATLDAYARGVNASMADAGSHLPLEFMLLRYKPRPWTATDTLLAGINMAQMLNQSYPDDLRREQVEARVSPEIYRDLYPASFWRDHPPGSEPAEIKDEVPPPVVVAVKEQAMPDPGGWVRRAGLAVENDSCAECRPGSNDWVVSGEHSTTGKPLLSNDMHLAHSVPGIWYQAQLKLADGSLNVIGVTLPGVPFVIVGHNERIAWGFTNLGPDVQDLFIENIDQANGNYQTPQGPQPLEIRHEIIQVAKGQSVSFDVQVTRHGPIITPVVEGESRQLALEWTLHDPVNGIRFPFLEINRARNWQEFTTAFSKFSGPGQNVVYADVDGHIGYHATGMVPIRAAGDGTVPVSGADGAHDWTGYIPFDKMPWSYDPPSGILATANNRVTPEHYPYLITTDWGSPYRAERIYQFLRSKPKLSPNDMFTLETDIYSNFEKFFADRFAYAIDHTPNADAHLRQAADLLRRWDGRMSINSAAARIETLSRKRLFETLLRSKLGDNYKLYTRWGSTSVLENIVNLQPPRWLPKQYSDWNIFLADQVKTALADAPSDLKRWSYGGYNQLTVQNPVIAAAPFLKKFAGPGTLPQSGSGATVKQVGPDFGPSERFTADFSDWDHSHLNTVTGESGNFLSPFFLDQWSAWYNNTTFDLPFTDAAVARSTMYKLTLNPGGK